MKTIIYLFIGLFILQSCNKEFENIPATPLPTPTSGSSIGELINSDTSFSFLKAVLAKSGLESTLTNTSLQITAILPDNNAFRRSGISSLPIVNAVFADMASARGFISYNLIPQVLPVEQISTGFPNLQEPTFLNPAPQVSSLLRLSTFPSKRGNLVWINNIPLEATNIAVSNGVVHRPFVLVAPPTQFLWDRINADTSMAYFKAAIQRADSGVATASTLQAALQNIGASLTVFAPTNLAFQQLLTAQITQALVGQGMDAATAAAIAANLASTPDVFSNPLLSNVLTPQTVKGLVVYHLLGKRVFSVNIPVTATSVPTLLNTAIATHPGVSIQSVFGATGVTAATVKGVMNATASSVLINPAPNGTSDQHYLNGVIHKIDQVLLPQ